MCFNYQPPSTAASARVDVHHGEAEELSALILQMFDTIRCVYVCACDGSSLDQLRVPCDQGALFAACSSHIAQTTHRKRLHKRNVLWKSLLVEASANMLNMTAESVAKNPGRICRRDKDPHLAMPVKRRRRPALLVHIDTRL